jgi:hypothetical protein
MGTGAPLAKVRPSATRRLGLLDPAKRMQLVRAPRVEEAPMASTSCLKYLAVGSRTRTNAGSPSSIRSCARGMAAAALLLHENPQAEGRVCGSDQTRPRPKRVFGGQDLQASIPTASLLGHVFSYASVESFRLVACSDGFPVCRQAIPLGRGFSGHK